MDEFIFKKILTAIAIVLYLLLFFYIYLQLILILVYNYKRWCYRTAVLYICIIWAGMRITLFSYYLCGQFGFLREDFPELSRHVGKLGYFILFTLPLYLQFSVLCLLVAYFSKILAISDDYYNASHLCTTKLMKNVILAANFVVLIVNVACSILIKEKEEILPSHGDNLNVSEISDFPLFIAYLIYFRVVINGSMFIVLSLLLGIVVFRVSKTEEARLLLETENITQKGAKSMGIVVVGLYILRTAANILALIPSVEWVYDTDQVDLLSDSSHGYYMFICVLFLWEYLPTLATVYFFRAKKANFEPVDSLPVIVYPQINNEDEEPLFEDHFDSCSVTFEREAEPIAPWFTSYLGGDNRLPSTDDSSPGFRNLSRSNNSHDRLYS